MKLLRPALGSAHSCGRTFQKAALARPGIECSNGKRNGRAVHISHMHRSDLHARIRRRPGQALGMIGLAAQCCSVERPPAVVSHSPAESAACFQGFTRKSRRGVAAIISSAACRFPARLNDVGKRPRVCSEDAFPLFFTAGQSSLRRGRGRDTPYALRKGGRLPDDAQDAAHPRPEKARQLPRWRPESNIRPGCPWHRA